MKIDSIKFKGHRCFKNDWVGFDEIKPINVIIGRNNTGKSHLLDLVRKCCHWDLWFEGSKFKCSTTLDEAGLQQQFSPTTSGGTLGGNHWTQHGQRLVGQEVNWEVLGKNQISNLTSIRSDYLDPDNNSEPNASYSVKVGNVVSQARHELDGSAYRHLLADRDLKPEAATEAMSLSNDGEGATNIIRSYLTSSDPKYPRDLITGEFLTGLNDIFGNDGDFTEINVQFHDYEGVEERNVWEIYLGEERKGIVPLSKSGSGLKTVILVLLNLIIVPEVEKRARSEYVYSFEELENNLHPALLRRLFQYIEAYSQKHRATFFLTTHSSVALDFFGLSDKAQIIHVKHNKVSATTSVVSAHFDKVGLVAELGAKPSDLLQANGIVWVEGPSDRIYINHWIELLSGGELQEGRDYQCAFYGGALLAKNKFTSPDEEAAEKAADKERVNLLRVNPNVYVICDGDRSGPKTKIKDRVRRISREVKAIPGAGFWATKGREIENYVPGEVIKQALDRALVPDPGQYDSFFPRTKSKSDSFIEKYLSRKTLDKTQFAVECVKHMTIDNMKGRFDWEVKVTEIVQFIRKWNA
jgi:hypothetical protein